MMAPSKKPNGPNPSITKKDSVSGHYLPFSSVKKSQKQSKLKLNQSKDLPNLQSSKISKLSSKSTHIQSTKFRIKLPSGFYNDERTSFYLNKSKSLSEKSVCYQVRPLSYTQRNKLQSQKLENIVHRRKTQIQNDNNLEAQLQKNNLTSGNLKKGRTQSSTYIKFLPISKIVYNQKETRPISESVRLKQGSYSSLEKKNSLAQKFKNHTFEKYNKLVYGSKLKEIETKMLKNDISRICSQRMIKKKWYPPFQSANTLREKFQGKSIISNSPLKKIKQSVKTKQQNNQIKVLNIDKMFRKKEGKLTNIVAFQVPKFSEITAIKNVNLITNKKNKDNLNAIIEEFNTLLRISKLKKAHSSSKILGVKGKNFTKSPTFQELMGLKLKPKANSYFQEAQQIPQQIFVQHSTTYNSVIKEDFELPNRLVAGLKQNSKTFSLKTLTRFYSLFVNKIATSEQKIRFFSYFFIPLPNEQILKSQILDIFSSLCKQKSISSININLKTETLSDSQKSSIFLEALTRVMFGTISESQTIDRLKLYNILQENDEAIDLLMKLIAKDY